MTDSQCPRDELLAALELGALSPAEERDLHAHLPSCAVCREALEENRRAASALRAVVAPRPSKEARDRAYAAVLAAMERPRAEQPAPPSEVKLEVKPASARAPRTSSKAKLVVTMKPAQPAKRAGFRIVGGIVAAAACIFVVVGVFSSDRHAAAPAAAEKQLGRADLPSAPTSSRKPVPPSDPALGAARPPAPPAAPAPPREALARDEKSNANAFKRAQQGPETQPFPGATETQQADRGFDEKPLKEEDKGGVAAAEPRATRVPSQGEALLARRKLLDKARRIVALEDYDATVRRERTTQPRRNAPPPSAPKAGKEGGSKSDDDATEKAGDGTPTGGAAAGEKKKQAAESAEKRDAPAPEPAPGKKVKDEANDEAKLEAEQEKADKLGADKAPAAKPADRKAAEPKAQVLFSDPFTDARKLLVEDGADAYWVASVVKDSAIALLDSRSPIHPDDEAENAVLLRILDEHLARERKDVEWARRAVALESAIEGARLKANVDRAKALLEQKKAAEKQSAK